MHLFFLVRTNNNIVIIENSPLPFAKCNSWYLLDLGCNFVFIWDSIIAKTLLCSETLENQCIIVSLKIFIFADRLEMIVNNNNTIT